jgi:hypothetical protein
VATITGPIVTPSLYHVGLNALLAFNITLGVGDSLVIDGKAKSITLNGTASRQTVLSPTSLWWLLLPGSNVVQFGAASGTGTLSFAYKSDWH